MNWVTRQHKALPETQRGAVVLMLLVIIAVSTATYFFVHELNNTRLQIERDKINAAALAQARDAVLGFALANNDMPGGLPFPDRKENNNPNYDGNGDCVTTGLGNDHLLGKFPFLYEEGCGTDRAFDISPTDASGERLWYAASKYLVKSAGGHFPIPTNTSTLMASTNQEWLTVVNESGAVISSQVAFILIAPGGVLPDQNRAGTAPDARNYLDVFTVGATTHSNWENSDLSFITAKSVNNASNRFNDRLLYVTRDEFINRLVWRVAGEISLRIGQYHLLPPDNTYPPNLSVVYTYVPPAPPPSPVPFPSAIWFPENWANITTYTPSGTDQATIQFSGCASVFTIAWDNTINQSRLHRSGPC